VTARLLLSAPDRPGLAAAVSGFVAEHGGSIVEADQYTDAEQGVLFQRVEFDLRGFDLDRDQLGAALGTVTNPFGMAARVRFSDDPRRIANLVPKQVHCLYALPARCDEGALPAEVAFVAGNHDIGREAAGRFDVPFHHLPVTGADRPEQEAAIVQLVESSGASSW